MKKINTLIGYGMGGFIVDHSEVKEIYDFAGDNFIYFEGVLYNVRIHQKTPEGLPIYGIRWDLSRYDLDENWCVVDHFEIDEILYRKGGI